MQLTKKENDLWAKYYGKDLRNNDEFWKDVFEVYREKNILLPLEHTDLNVLRVLRDFECKKCGECCKYKFVPLKPYDIKRLLDAGLPAEKLVDHDGTCLNSDKGCYFFLDGCQIYSSRPETCFMFPIQGPVEAEAQGRKIKQMRVRLKCLSTLNLIRKIIANSEGILLPDLTILEVQNGTDTITH
jgi:Fe-S-cluster containining protein